MNPLLCSVAAALGLISYPLFAQQPKSPAVTRIASGATYEWHLVGLTSHSLISIFGTDLAEATAAAKPPLPTELGGVRLSIGGKPAPLLYVSPTQINAQVPAFPESGAMRLATRYGALEFQAPRGFPAPALFPQQGGGCGPAMIFNVGEDGSWQLNGPSNPATPGSRLAVLATAAGSDVFSLKDGEAPTSFAHIFG